MRLPVLLCVAVSLCAAASPEENRSCTDLRRFYTGKGFTLEGVPQTEISGEFLENNEAGTQRMHNKRLDNTFPNIFLTYCLFM